MRLSPRSQISGARPDEQIGVTAGTFKPWDALACECRGDPERELQP